MRPADLDALLREAPRARRARLKGIQVDLEQAVAEPWFDRSCWEAVVTVCQRCGLNPPVWRPAPLGVGEAWLLLYEGLAGVGTVAKLRVNQNDMHGPPLLGPEAQAEVRCALAGLIAMLSAHHKRLPEFPFNYPLAADSPTESAIVTGGSLGTAACVAVTSAALRAPAATDVAATASVSADGTLRPVGFLKEKLDALVRHQPGVTRLVVAEAQPLPEGHWPVQFARCATLAQALGHFGLSWDQLPTADVTDFLRYLSRFRFDDEQTTATADWERLADTALTTYRVLSNAGTAHRGDAGQALGWWVLFSAHAGRAADLDAFQTDFAALSDAVEPHVKVLIDVFAASALIDGDPACAIESSRAAVEAGRRLTRGSETVLGRALGTHGRALLHHGTPALAIPFLAEAVVQHRQADPREVPRSLTYLATATRMAGDAAAALALCDEAIHELQGSKYLSWACKTRAYLQLERGRCLLELQRSEEAVTAFDEVARSCEYDYEYPRSGALRGLAAAHRALGNHQTASELHARCLSVASDAHHGKLFRQVAAMAIADAWFAMGQNPQEQELEIWRDLFAQPTSFNDTEDVRARWVY